MQQINAYKGFFQENYFKSNTGESDIIMGATDRGTILSNYPTWFTNLPFIRWDKPGFMVEICVDGVIYTEPDNNFELMDSYRDNVVPVRITDIYPHWQSTTTGGVTTIVPSAIQMTANSRQYTEDLSEQFYTRARTTEPVYVSILSSRKPTTDTSTPNHFEGVAYTNYNNDSRVLAETTVPFPVLTNQESTPFKLRWKMDRYELPVRLDELEVVSLRATTNNAPVTNMRVGGNFKIYLQE